MEILGIRPVVLVVAACLALAMSSVLVSACSGPDVTEPDVRTPPARGVPSDRLGGAAGDGADGVGGVDR